ncbi:MAG: serine hydroxymethyltransferase [Actinobacteria bacterium]|nr:serine hydroxymethyltransferase [Actinomycetota bacterium]
MKYLRTVDSEVYNIIKNEIRRQQAYIDLIASENYTPIAVLEAQGSALTNKYAEGYPGERYYGGCDFVDDVESLAIERAKKLFGAEHVNVQPHAGSQANMAVYLSQIKPGDVILGQGLKHGGHLTHGAKASFSGRLFNSYEYGVNRETEMLDYDEILRIAKECRPKIIVSGSSSYSREIDFKKFGEIADEVGALLMADIAHIAGLVVGKVHKSPIPHAHFVTGTTHKTMRGPRGGMIMCEKRFAKDVDRTVFPGIQGGPLMHIIAAKAVSFKLCMQDDFKLYAQKIVENAKVFAVNMKERGFRIISGGTDNHMFLVDVSVKGLNGKQAEEALKRVGIVLNKNVIPYDPQNPHFTSGIRIGTPAVTTRGMGPEEMEVLAQVISEVLVDGIDESAIARNSKRVSDLTAGFPIYKELN